MNKLFSYLLIFLSSFFLGGCNLIDEYYTYDKNFLTNLENKLGSMKDDDKKKELITDFEFIFKDEILAPLAYDKCKHLF